MEDGNMVFECNKYRFDYLKIENLEINKGSWFYNIMNDLEDEEKLMKSVFLIDFPGVDVYEI
jgi:hypothetical protein